MSIPFNANSAQGATRHEVRLLVVDDLCEETEALFEIADLYHPDFVFSYKRVSDSSQALDTVAEWDPSVVLVDLHVVADAISLVEQLANFGSAVVALSETKIPELEDRIKKCGGRSYLAKSTNVEEIEDILHLLGSIARGRGAHH
jgi:CheY-like chemotaxis protein